MAELLTREQREEWARARFMELAGLGVDFDSEVGYIARLLNAARISAEERADEAEQKLAEYRDQGAGR